MTNGKMENLIKKVKGLFALAENNPSETEAQAALAAARKLVNEYGLSMMDVQVEQAPESNLGDERVHLHGRKRYPQWVLQLASIIARYCSVGIFYTSGAAQPVVTFYGAKHGATIASTILPSVMKQVEDLSKAYRTKEMDYANSKGFTRRARESYRSGLLEGFRKALREMKQAEAQCEQTTALAVYNEDLVKRWRAQSGMHFQNTRLRQKSAYSTDYQNGYSDSGKLSINPLLS